MCLAQIEDNDYYCTYAYLEDDHYMIIDNGAAEGSSVSDRDLIRAASRMGADEVVVPDVLRDFRATVSRVEAFFNEGSYLDLSPATRFMVVAQGSTITGVKKCIDLYMDSFDDTVLGIPRHLLTTLDTKLARVYVLNYIQDKYPDTTVHLLGTNTVWTREVMFIAKEFPWVRGIDSSMPYNYAIAGKRLDDLHQVDRPEKYFDYVHNVDEDLLWHNINVFMEWASGTESTRS